MTKATKIAPLVAIAVVLLSACSVLGDGGSDSSGITVSQAVMSSAINDQGQATAPGRIFLSNVSRIYAVVNLEGVKPGVEISGKWFQTGVENVPAEGSEVHSSTIKLDDKTATEGRSRVALFLPATTQGIPEDAWIVRIYAGKDLVRTLAFVVVAPPAGSAAPPAQANPPPEPTAAAQTYTVVSGDTLQTIANRFKPANEDVVAFTNRLRQANNLTSDNLNIGQVLRIP
jgi:LysM repeat protein